VQATAAVEAAQQGRDEVLRSIGPARDAATSATLEVERATVALGTLEPGGENASPLPWRKDASAPLRSSRTSRAKPPSAAEAKGVAERLAEERRALEGRPGC